MSRLSVRTWSKGSARGVGPSVQVAAVYIQQNRVGLCAFCGTWTFAPGLHHGSRVAMGVAGGWPVCEHGRRYLINCADGPVPPSCCVPQGWGVLALVMLVVSARRTALFPRPCQNRPVMARLASAS